MAGKAKIEVLVTSHGNADFDAFAAMVAITKLYPEAHILFSGTRERALDRFLDNPFYDFEETTVSEVDFSALKRLILVDLHSLERLGPLAAHIDTEKTEIIIFDHHDVADTALLHPESIIRPSGSTTTILVRELRKRSIAVSRIEATIFSMGIYEDTGFLSYATTTPEDARQIAWLLENGADLSLVNRFLKSDLSRKQIDLFNDLIINTMVHDIHGTPAAFSMVSRDDYLADAAAVVHRLLDVERHQVFIAIIRMGEKIHVIGRSRNRRVDIGAALERIGGGGHGPAAYASLSGKTLVEVKELLYAILQETVPPEVVAQDIMSRNLLTFPVSMTTVDAHKAMVQANVNSAPVIEDGQVTGMVTRQQLDRALAHGLRDSLLEVATPEVTIIKPTDSISVAEQHIMEGTQRSVLVGNSPRSVEGIITRMDLFRRLYLEKHHEARDIGAAQKSHKRRKTDIEQMLRKRLSPIIHAILKAAAEVSEIREERVYLVGGIVRDLILDFANEDVDLLVIGDGISFAEELNQRLEGHLHTHDSFGTAVIVLDELHVDVVTARREHYRHPGALPDVEKGSLRADLYRRDFTINSLAIDVGAGNYGELVDYFGGMRDIHEKKVRILHGLSFIDDPTRILRAIRFCIRLNFDLSSGTCQMLRSAVERKMLNRVSGSRIYSELMLLLRVPRPIAAVEMLHDFGVFSIIHPKIIIDRFTRELLEKISDAVSWFSIEFKNEPLQRELIYFMALTDKLTDEERGDFLKHLDVPTAERKILSEYKRTLRRLLGGFREKDSVVMSDVVDILENSAVESVVYAYAFAHDERLKELISIFLSDVRYVKIEISGHDVLNMGVKRGPAVGRILNKVKRERVNGNISDRQSQLTYARELAEKEMYKP